MKEILELFKPSIKKRPVRWCLILVVGYFLFHFIPPVAVAAANYVADVLFKKEVHVNFKTAHIDKGSP